VEEEIIRYGLNFLAILKIVVSPHGQSGGVEPVRIFSDKRGDVSLCGRLLWMVPKGQFTYTERERGLAAFAKELSK